MSNHGLAIAAGCVAVLTLFAPPAVFAQQPQMDMNEMMKWGQARYVNYHIVGVYDAKTAVSSTGAGFADVKDRVVIDMKWDLTGAGLIGAAKFENTVSTASNFRDSEPTCLPPVLKGPFEHYDVLKVENGLSASLKLSVKTTFPVTEVAQFCTASRKAMPAKVVERPIELVIPSPVLFGMGGGNTGEVTYLRDKQQIVWKHDGWTWTYSPTIAKQ